MLAATTGRSPAWTIALFAAVMAVASWSALEARPAAAQDKAATESAEPAAAKETDADEKAANESDADEKAAAGQPAEEAAADQDEAASGPVDEGAETEEAAPAAGAPAKAARGDDSRVAIMLALVAAVFIIPVVAGHYTAKALRMPDHATRISVVLFAILASTVATLSGWPPKLGIDLRGGVILIYEVDQENFKEMDKLVSAVAKRVNPGGIKEVTVRPYGEREIEIIVPEADQEELDRLQTIVSQTGQLEFRIVADRRFKYDADIMDLAQEPRFANKKEVTQEADADLVEGDEEAGEQVVAKWVPIEPKEALRFAQDSYYSTRVNKRGQLEGLVLTDRYNVTGDYLTSATGSVDQFGKPCVNFVFNSQGANRFGKLTSSNLPDATQPDLKHALAIILDNQLYSAPTINSAIYDRGEITGNFTQQQVDDLAAVLTAGSLPTTLRKEPTSSLLTGPTLGQDTIRKGVYSMVVSTVAVVVFMIFYYRFAGVVANVALLLNVLLIVAFMILFNAAFTLSGLAGLALTVGMAVDANVLIYERIREELTRGATLRMAIRNGFDRASTTIIDANVTTLISAIVLYAIGTDQVKGFAVTLVLGIMMNMFTAITFSRLIFDIAERQRWISQLRMLKALENPNFDFIGKRHIAFAVSAVLIVAGLVGVVERGKGLLDIDFTGGVSVETLFDKDQKIGDVRQKVADLPDVTVQEVSISDEPPHRRFLIITSKSDIDEANPPKEGPKTNIDWVETELKEVFGDELAFNHLSWSEIEPIAAAPAEKKAAAAGEKAEEKKPEESKAEAKEEQPETKKKAEPKKEETTAKEDAEAEQDSKEKDGAEPKDSNPKDDAGASLNRPGEMLLALAEDADNPAAKDAPASDASDETKSEAKSDEPAPKEPAGEAAEATDEKEAAPAASSEETTAETKAGKETAAEQSAAADPFAGGSKTVLTFSQAIGHDAVARRIQDALAADESLGDDTLFEVDNPMYEEGSQRGFQEWTLKIAANADQTAGVAKHVQQALAAEPYFPSSNKVGASVAGNTQLQATYALLASLVMIIVYVWIRFQLVSFGLSSVLALVHDVLVALGALALSYWLARLPFAEALLIEPFKINLPIIAAFLTIIGYSINDTIVIFDRIREVRGKSQEIGPELVNRCVNQTLSRTLLTSLTVFIVVLILYMFGGQGIHGFAFTLVVGTISGTYSTIYIATPLLIWMNRSKSDANKGASGTSRETARV